METKNFYSQKYLKKLGVQYRVLERRERKAIELIQKLVLPDDAKILDVGCGDGYFLQSLVRSLDCQVSPMGGDYSKYRCKEAAEKTGYPVKHLNLEKKLKFSDSTFDLVYAGEVIEHLYNPDNMVQEISRIIKPGGYFLLTTPNMNSWISRLMFFFFGMQPLNYECSTESSLYGYRLLKKIKKQDFPVGHIRMFNSFSVSDMLMDNGFNKPRIYGSIFEFMPKILLFIDIFFTLFPKLSSDLVVIARKVK